MSRLSQVISAALAIALAGCQGPTAADAPAASAPPAQAASTAVDRQVDALSVRAVASGLQHPWGLAFLPEGGFLVTERVGTLRRVSADGVVSAPIAGVPAVVAEGQGGLLDVALAPDFAQSRLVYLSYSEPGEDKLAGTAVARGRLEDDRLADVEVIFRQQPKLDTRHHFGSRLVFTPDGYLFITMGDRGVRPTAQDLSSHMGTVARVRPDGSVPEDNPFVGREGAQPETWSYGHRNQQGAALNPWTGQLWTHEHGPRGGDEVNIPQAGRNYGWPIVTHGINYSGQPIPEAVGREREGLEPPHHVWEVSPGVSGMAFYDDPRHPRWQRSLFVGAMAQRQLIRLSLDGDRVVGEERLLGELQARIRDVRVGPDGALYLLTDDINGSLLRVEPAGE